VTDHGAVLLVDDDETFREMLTILLGAHGWSTTGACDGSEALATLREGPLPALMIVDLRMPRMNGIELLRALQAEPAWRHVPVIVITGDLGATHEAMAAGARACLYKPVDAEEFLASVRRHAA
jgi:CheY-like chemotaxis protein